jgi:hypothetical protein
VTSSRHIPADADLTYFTVTCHLAPIVADLSQDSDYDPNTARIDAVVTFTPKYKAGEVIHSHTSTPPTGFLALPVTALIDDGYLKLRAKPDVGAAPLPGTLHGLKAKIAADTGKELPVTTDVRAALNYAPVRLLGNSATLEIDPEIPLYYDFTFTNIKIDGKQTNYVITGGHFEAPWEDTVIDLLDYMPLTPGPFAAPMVVGPQGPPGEPGPATVNVGTTTTSDPGTDAAVTNAGDGVNAVFDFVIPRGEVGPIGPAGGLLEFDTVAAFPATGTTGQVYLAKDTGDAYRWDGSAKALTYVRISERAAWDGVTDKPLLPFDVVGQGKVDNTGAVNVRAAIQSIIDANYTQRPIRFPAGQYLFGDAGATSGGNSINLPDGTHLIADPGAVFLVNARDFQSGRTAMFSARGTAGTAVAFTVDQPHNSAMLTLPAGSGATFKVGDVIGVSSDADRAYELHKVQAVSGDVLDLDSALDFDYLVADAAKFWKVTPVRVTFQGGTFRPGPGIDYSGPIGSTHTYAIRIDRGSGCILRGVTLENMTGGVLLDDCIDTLVDDLRVDRLPIQVEPSPPSGYGLNAMGGTANLIVNGLWGRETRHVFTTRNNTHPTSGPRDIQINNAVGYGSVLGGYAIFDTHNDGRRIQFNNCMAVGLGFETPNLVSLTAGFQIRAQDVYLNNCVATHCTDSGVTATDTAARVVIAGGQFSMNDAGVILNGSTDCHLLNANVFNNYDHGVKIGRAVRPVISNVRLYNNGQSGAAVRTGVSDDPAALSVNAIITDCYIPWSSTQTYAFDNLSSSAKVINCHMPGYTGLFNYGPANFQMWNVITDKGVEYTGGTMKAPALSGALRDQFGGKWLEVIGRNPSGNWIQISNRAAGAAPQILSAGGDTDVSLQLIPKGVGIVSAAGTQVEVKGHVHTVAQVTGARSWAAVPASSTATGTAGQEAYDANFHYICVGTNTWKRIAYDLWV